MVPPRDMPKINIMMIINKSMFVAYYELLLKFNICSDCPLRCSLNLYFFLEINSRLGLLLDQGSSTLEAFFLPLLIYITEFSSLFGSTNICESTFSTMYLIKSINKKTVFIIHL